MGYGREEHPECSVDLFHYLQSWGLREFHDEASYYEWQRSILSNSELQELQRLIEQRHGGEDVDCDRKFYDLLARPDLVPVLYSQRFHYFLTVGSSLVRRIQQAKCVLDFGCGVGIITLFFARQYPSIEFVGIDRSVRSIETARLEAEKRGIQNVQFELSPLPDYPISQTFDLILSTQALLQSEREPGLPSRSWKTFQRGEEGERQEQLEIRTGLRSRLDSLLSTLHQKGRMIIFEKTWNLGRRIFLQRALESRGLRPISSPVFCRYQELEEVIDDGPLYEVARVPKKQAFGWTEDPYREPGDTFYRCTGEPAVRMSRELAQDGVIETVSGNHSGMGSWTFRFGEWNHALVWGFFETASGLQGLVIGGEEDQHLLLPFINTITHIQEEDLERLVADFWGTTAIGVEELSIPCYENHYPSAQSIYESLPCKQIQQESTLQDGAGRERHMELGATKNLIYLYWANTYDQRQLVIMDRERISILQAYYQESSLDANTFSA